MPEPINMNQVLSQAPQVERIQHVESQHPEQFQRYAAVEGREDSRKRSETVRETEKGDQPRRSEADGRRQEQEGGTSRRQAKDAQEQPTEDAPESPKEPRIVDVVV